MQPQGQANGLEELVAQWRAYVLRRQGTPSVDLTELEHRLRQQIVDLVEAGLATEEAFLVAVKRISAEDGLTREFALAHSERLWKQGLVGPSGPMEPRGRGQHEFLVVIGLAVAAAAAVKVPVLFGRQLDEHQPADVGFYLRNASLLVLPLLALYFAWKRRPGTRTCLGLGVAFIVAAVFANIYPFARASATEVLSALHLPIALWLVVGISHAGGCWSQPERRMSFVRFSGELFIYYVLIALGGGVLTAFMGMIFKAIGINVGPFIGEWLLPCGAAGAVLVASWLVESKQRVMENMAPILTRLFTPMFATMLIMFLATLLWTGRGIDVTRDVLIAFDLLLVVIIGLLLYSASARDPQSPPNTFDRVQVVLIVSALLADGVALWANAARITEFGITPNRVAALGENVVLLANLAWSAVLYLRFLRGRGSFASLEKWQTDYLPVYGGWAAVVVILFPPLFRYI